MYDENLVFTDDKSNNDSILGVLEGPCADFVDSTRNNRHYSEELWENVFKSPLVKELIDNGGIPGELDHPADREDTCSERIAILLKEIPKKKDGKLWAKFSILNTPLGRIAYTLAKAGFKYGISSRGSGDVIESFDGNEEVDPSTYDFKAFDLVLIPAVKEARLSLVTESLDNKFNYKKALLEQLNTSTKEEKSIIESTIKHLGISLNEDVDTSSYGFVSKAAYEKFVKVSKLLSDTLSKYDKIIDNIENSAITDEEKEALESNDTYQLLIDTFSRNYEDIYELEEIIKNGALQVVDKPNDNSIMLNMNIYTINDLYDLLSNLNKIIENDSIKKYLNENLQYNGFDITITGSGADLRKSDGTFVQTFPTEEEAKEYVDSLNESLLNEESTKEDIIKLVEEKFGVTDEPFKGITFIMPDGKFLDLRNSNHHSDVEKFLIDSNLSDKQYSINTGSETLTSLGAIRCDTIKYYMQLSDDVQPTGVQYQSILRWLDFCSKYLKSIEIYNQDGSENTLYNFTESIPDDILNKIRRYYSSGRLYEAKEMNQKMQHNFKYGRDKSKSINEEIIIDDKDESSEEDVDIDVTLEKDEGVVDPSDILEQLQASLLENRRLADTISKLQEKVSVCNAKDEKNESIILKQKQSINKLTESVKSNLTLKRELSAKTNLIEQLNSKILNYENNINKLNEDLNSLKKEKASLIKNETLYRKEISKKISKLQESIKSYDLNENKYIDTVEGLKKDLLQKQNEFKLKLNQKEKLIEQYKKKSAFIVDKYIDLQASVLGIESSDIKNRLNENYSFKDIDRICEDYKNYTVNMNSLPFDTSVNLKVKNPFKQNLVPSKEDEVDDQLLRMSGLK